MIGTGAPGTGVRLKLSYHIQYNSTSRRSGTDQMENLRGGDVCYRALDLKCLRITMEHTPSRSECSGEESAVNSSPINVGMKFLCSDSNSAMSWYPLFRACE